MSKAAVDYLSKKIDDAIHYVKAEFDMNISEAVGVLEIAKHMIIRGSLDAENETDNPEARDGG